MLPVPGCRTIEASPDEVFDASAGGLATLSGAGIGAKAGGFCWATKVAPSATVTKSAEIGFIIPTSSLNLIAFAQLNHTW